MIGTQAPQGTRALNKLILERLAIDKRVGFRYRTLERLGPEALERALEQGILRETHRARTIEHPDRSAPTLYDLKVQRREEGLFAVSAEGDELVPPVLLTEDDIRQFELMFRRLCRRICMENAIEEQIREYECEIVFLGERELDGFGLRPIYLFCGNTSESQFVDRCRSIHGARGWTIILTPMAVNLSPANRRYLDEMNILLVPMAHYLTGDGWKLPWGRITAGFSSQWQPVENYQPVADLTYAHLPGLVFAPNHRSVHLHDKHFALTNSMIRIVQFMIDNSPSGPRDIPQSLILEECECRSPKLLHIFKRLPNWKELIAPGSTKGTYRLNL